MRSLYPHPNRVLFYDDVLITYLLAFFNPAVRSLRSIEDLSEVPAINQHLSVKSVCRSTLSDANSLFDPDYLLPLIEQLRQKVPDLARQDRDLAKLLDKVLAIDGSFFRVASDVQWATTLANKYGGRKFVRLNLSLGVNDGLVDGLSIDGNDGRHEGTAAKEFIREGHIHLFDGGVVNFDLFHTILALPDTHLLCSLRDHINFTTMQEQPLSEKDKEAGVTSDRVGVLTGSNARVAPGQTLREVRVSYTDRKGKVCSLRLLTSLLDLPAAVIAALYRYRWQIELFFRWLKVDASFEHLTSYSRNGVKLSFHIAVIAQLLICIHTQSPPSRYSQMLLGYVASGQATVEEILPIVLKRERERALERARLARKRQADRASKKSE